MGYTDLSSYGAKDWSTPSLDQMANEGCPIYQLLCAYTGLFAFSSRVANGEGTRLKLVFGRVISPRDPSRGCRKLNTRWPKFLNLRVTQRQLLGSGIWAQTLSFFRLIMVFDSWFGLPYSNDYSPKSINNPRSYAVQWPELPLIRDTTIVEREPDQRYLTERYTQEVLQVIRRQSSPALLPVFSTFDAARTSLGFRSVFGCL